MSQRGRPRLEGTHRHSMLAALLRLFFEPEIAAFEGRAPLGRVFWLYGVVTSCGIALLYRLALEAGRAGLQQGLLLLLAAYTVWVLVAVWRCAANAAPFWRTLARSLTVTWAANAILLGSFLELELLARLGGP